MGAVFYIRDNADRSHEREMALRYTIEEALQAILDDDFGLSDGESSDEEGDDIYGYIGEYLGDQRSKIWAIQS